MGCGIVWRHHWLLTQPGLLTTIWIAANDPWHWDLVVPADPVGPCLCPEALWVPDHPHLAWGLCQTPLCEQQLSSQPCVPLRVTPQGTTVVCHHHHRHHPTPRPLSTLFLDTGQQLLPSPHRLGNYGKKEPLFCRLPRHTPDSAQRGLAPDSCLMCKMFTEHWFLTQLSSQRGTWVLHLTGTCQRWGTVLPLPLQVGLNPRARTGVPMRHLFLPLLLPA